MTGNLHWIIKPNFPSLMGDVYKAYACLVCATQTNFQVPNSLDGVLLMMLLSCLSTRM